MKKGFTLLETIISITIFGIMLGAILILFKNVNLTNVEITNNEIALYKAAKFERLLNEKFNSVEEYDLHYENDTYYLNLYSTMIELHMNDYIQVNDVVYPFQPTNFIQYSDHVLIAYKVDQMEHVIYGRGTARVI